MSLDPIDRLIAQEVGQLCWYILPDMYANLQHNEEDEAFREVWRPDEDSGLQAVRDENPPVNYPAIFLPSIRGTNGSTSPFIFPPTHGKPLRLSDYLAALRQFVILQLTAEQSIYAQHISYAVRLLADTAPQEKVLQFVDQLWRGRWVVGADEWGMIRLSAITGGTSEGRSLLESNIARLEAEAFRLVQIERRLKDTAESMDEWLHEAYCLLPEIFTWLFVIRNANERHHSDELEKYDRVLDEFLADIHTTLLIAGTGAQEGRGLAYHYAIEPLMKHRTVEEAIKEIRGTYRGRSIVPRVWYELAKEGLNKVLASDTRSNNEIGTANVERSAAILPADVRAALDRVDAAASFGRAITKDSKEDQWLFIT